MSSSIVDDIDNALFARELMLRRQGHSSFDLYLVMGPEAYARLLHALHQHNLWYQADGHKTVYRNATILRSYDMPRNNWIVLA